MKNFNLLVQQLFNCQNISSKEAIFMKMLEKLQLKIPAKSLLIGNVSKLKLLKLMQTESQQNYPSKFVYPNSLSCNCLSAYSSAVSNKCQKLLRSAQNSGNSQICRFAWNCILQSLSSSYLTSVPFQNEKLRCASSCHPSHIATDWILCEILIEWRGSKVHFTW